MACAMKRHPISGLAQSIYIYNNVGERELRRIC